MTPFFFLSFYKYEGVFLRGGVDEGVVSFLFALILELEGEWLVCFFWVVGGGGKVWLGVVSEGGLGCLLLVLLCLFC